TSSPTFAGAAGTAAGDLSTITVRVYAGSTAGGSHIGRATCREAAGSWGVAASAALAGGTYTAQAAQDDSAGNHGLSSANTFTINTAAPDTTPPLVTWPSPAAVPSVTTSSPTFAGAAGTAAGDLSTITVRVYAGSTAGGS